MFFTNYNGGPVVKLSKNESIYDNLNMMSKKKIYSYVNSDDYILNYENKDYTSIVQLIDEGNNIEYISNPNIPIRENKNIFKTYDIISENEISKIESANLIGNNKVLNNNDNFNNKYDEALPKKNKTHVSNMKSKDYNSSEVKVKSNVIIKQNLQNDENEKSKVSKNKNKPDWKRIDDLLDLINNK